MSRIIYLLITLLSPATRRSGEAGGGEVKEGRKRREEKGAGRNILKEGRLASVRDLVIAPEEEREELRGSSEN